MVIYVEMKIHVLILFNSGLSFTPVQRHSHTNQRRLLPLEQQNQQRNSLSAFSPQQQPPQGAVTSVAFSHAGDFFASAGSDEQVKMFCSAIGDDRLFGAMTFQRRNSSAGAGVEEQPRPRRVR